MIVFGTRGKVIGAKQVPVACSSCGHAHQMLVGAQKYFHLYWIPVVPLPKSLYISCPGCQQMQEIGPSANTTSPLLASFKDEFKKSLRTPPYFFIGAALITIAIPFGIVANMKNEKRVQERLSHPEIGDVMVMHYKEPLTPGYHYSYVRILNVDVDGQTVTLAPATKAFKNSSDIKVDMVKEETGYTADQFKVSLTALDAEVVEVYEKAMPPSSI